MTPTSTTPDYVICLASASDAEPLLHLQRRLDRQSPFMMLEPDERDPDPERLHSRLAAQESTASFDLVAHLSTGAASKPPQLLGWLSVEVPPYRRAAHVGHLVLGVDDRFRARGIGGALLAEAVALSASRGLARLELTVMTDNIRAIGLYLRHGFAVEGLRRQSLRREGAFVDEYLMSRITEATTSLDDPAGTPGG